MSVREPIAYIVIDADYCTRTFGVSPCLAALSLRSRDKCFNMTASCSYRAALNLEAKALYFVEARGGLPKNGPTMFPALLSVEVSSSSVNIGGTDQNLGPMGKRATISARLEDFPYHDLLLDKYRDERISGAASFTGEKYTPYEHGTFFTRLRARWPFYAGRSMRYVEGYLVNGEIVDTTTMHFIITDMQVDDAGAVTIEGKDVLDLADNSRAVAPAMTNGKLAADLTTAAMSFMLSPPGIGDLEYPTSGFGSIGTELIAYTRVGDNITITNRGESGSVIASHTAGDTFQPSFSPRAMNIKDVLYTLLVDYAKINPAFIPIAKWNAEAARWAINLDITTDITKPEGVAKLIGELAQLGVLIWWDSILQEIGFKMNRPADMDNVVDLSDRNNFLSMAIIDRDEDRLNAIQFFTRLNDPFKSPTDPNSYARQTFFFDGPAQSREEYNDTRIAQVFCRWLNQGADSIVTVVGQRYLKRFRRAPVRYTFTLTAEDDADLLLTSVMNITSTLVADGSGRPTPVTVQLMHREVVEAGHSYKLTAQLFDYIERYPYITENDRPVYTASTPAQKMRGFYISDNNGLMSDGTEGYKLV